MMFGTEPKTPWQGVGQGTEDSLDSCLDHLKILFLGGLCKAAKGSFDRAWSNVAQKLLLTQSSEEISEWTQDCQTK